MTLLVPGQIETTYQSSFLYRKEGEAWLSEKLPDVVELVLDAADRGAMVVERVQDSACCGWDNASNDQTLLINDGKRIPLFDERRRFGNADYDVTFFTSVARLSPDLKLVAFTLSSTAREGAEIRLSDQGKPDASALARVERAVRELPAIEVVRVEDPMQSVARMPHASLVGWLNDHQILILQEQSLVVFDLDTGKLSPSAIQVSSESHVFLR